MPDTPDLEENEADDPADLAPNEEEMRDILDEEQANMDAAATHGALGRGVQVLWDALKRIAKKQAEDTAYKASTEDLDEIDERLSDGLRALGAGGEGAMQAGPHGSAVLSTEQRDAFMALVQSWWSWAPSMMATGDPNLATFVQAHGPIVEANLRALMPAFGFPAEGVADYLASAPPFVPPAPNGGAPA